MNRALAFVPLARIARTPRGWSPIAGWSAVALVAAIAARAAGDTSGATHVLRGTLGYVALPLLAYGVVAAALGGAGLRASIRGVVALGADPTRAALASVLVATVCSALKGGILAVVVCAIAHGPTDPALLPDMLASFGVSFLGAGAYAAWFCIGSAIGRGGMRGGFLALDWFLGAPGGFGAIFVPRGHVTSLLGGQACFELSRRTSSVLLFLLLVVWLVVAVRLGRRTS